MNVLAAILILALLFSGGNVFDMSKKIRPIKFNYETEEQYRIAFAFAPSQHLPSYKEVAEAGFNVVHTYLRNDIKFLDECQKYGLKAIVPISGDNLEEVLNRIKDHPALLAVYPWDEPGLYGRPNKNEQEQIYERIKRVSQKVKLFGNWNGIYWKRWMNLDAADFISFSCYPYQWSQNPTAYLCRYEWKVRDYIKRDIPVIPIIQAFYGGQYKEPDVIKQYEFWSEHLKTNSYGVYCWGAGESALRGIIHDERLMREVREINNIQGGQEGKDSISAFPRRHSRIPAH
ncbi:hypothetical protein ES702_03022 [subsurface metagenome]